MADSKLFEELSEYQKSLGLRIFDLVLGRVLKRAYSEFDEKTKEDIEKVFSEEHDERPDEEKEKFIKKNIPDFEKLFKEESQKIEQELKAEIEKQI